jgi:hypothetical protein
VSRFDRRRFLQRLGQGSGSALLTSIAEATLARAQGTMPARKRVVFVLWSNGFPRPLMTPAGTPVGSAPVPGLRDFAWPAALAPLEKHRGRMLLIDNLANRVGFEHSAGYGALSAVNGDTVPGGITIDQHIARTLGATTVLKSLNLGVGGIHAGSRAGEAVVFASGARRPLVHPITVDGVFKRAFADNNPATFTEAARRRRLMLDPVRARLKALHAALAPTERGTLEHYAAALEDYDRRLVAVKPVECAAPMLAGVGPAAGTPGAPTALEDRLTAMNEMAILALSCGLTNVIGFSIGCGYAHSAPLWDKIQLGTPLASKGKQLDYGGHEPRDYAPNMTLILQFIMGLVARMADAWAKIPEGDGTLLDRTTIVLLSDSGGTTNGHHRDFTMGWPVILLGGAGGALKTDGRFLRYGQGQRSLGDLWSTVATAVGVPTRDFGAGGAEAAQGPLPEVLA